MKVSVIIPGYRGEFIGETLKSLFNQTVKPDEIMYIYDLNHSAEKVNRMVWDCRGEVIINLGDDDILAPDYIEKTVKAMEEHNVDIVYTDMKIFGARSVIVPAMDYTLDSFKISNPTFVTHLARKSAYINAGGWDKNIKYSDWDFNFRMFKSGATAFHLKEPLFEYRVHENQDTQSIDILTARKQVHDKHPEVNL